MDKLPAPPGFVVFLLVLPGLLIGVMLASGMLIDKVINWRLPVEALALSVIPPMPPADKETVTKLAKLREKLPLEDDGTTIGGLLYQYAQLVDMARENPTKESLLRVYFFRSRLRLRLTRRNSSS